MNHILSQEHLDPSADTIFMGQTSASLVIYLSNLYPANVFVPDV